MTIEEINQKRERLAQKKLDLAKRERKLITQSRKLRVKKLIELGGIIEAAGFFDFEEDALLGALLDAYANKDQNLDKWKALAADHKQKSSSQNGRALIIQLQEKPTGRTKSELRKRKFRFIEFRNEWHGTGNKQELLEVLAQAKPKIEIVKVL